MRKNQDFLVTFLLYKDELDLFIDEFGIKGLHSCFTSV